MGMKIELIDRFSLLNELNDKFQSIADINEVVIEQPTVEAIPKADMVAMLEELDLKLREQYDDTDVIKVKYVRQAIQQKINEIKETNNG